MPRKKPEPENHWCCIVEIDTKFGLMAARDGKGWSIHGFDSEQQGLRYFEEGYERAHARSYEASMSACLNYIMFHPSIVRGTIEDLREMIEKNTIMHYRNVAGSMHVIPLKREAAKRAWAAGSKPKLIQERLDWTHGRGDAVTSR